VSRGGIEDLEERVGNLGETLVAFHNSSETLEAEHGNLDLPRKGKFSGDIAVQAIDVPDETNMTLLDEADGVEAAALLEVAEKGVDQAGEVTAGKPEVVGAVAELEGYTGEGDGTPGGTSGEFPEDGFEEAALVDGWTPAANRCRRGWEEGLDKLPLFFGEHG
jgi:hypothetical protein